MKKILFSCLFFSFTVVLFSQNITYHLKENIQYYPDSINHLDSYINERCVLDVYYPKDSANFATVVWFHGGGITGGNKEIPEALKDKGIAVIGVNYRLSPKISAPKYIEDAAASISWVFNNINSFGGDSTLIFISGHSAGGYLAAMVGLDKTWLLKHHIDANNIAGIIPFSGQMITHFTIRNETNISSSKPIIDNFAPLYHVRDDAPPLLLITGDRELELLGRYEENAYLMRMMKVVGHKDTKLFELDGYNHGMAEPAFPLLLNEVRRIKENKIEE
jgi:acetyl esterase/lipase